MWCVVCGVCLSLCAELQLRLPDRTDLCVGVCWRVLEYVGVCWRVLGWAVWGVYRMSESRVRVERERGRERERDTYREREKEREGRDRTDRLLELLHLLRKTKGVA